MKLYEITTNEFDEEIDKKLIESGDLAKLEASAEKIIRTLNITKKNWTCLAGIRIGDEKLIMDRKRSLTISENKYFLIDND
ncbi:hypothetical protein AYJ58_13185 [Shewanella sp. Pdp11]|uniref:hypothetical protein n=1 Tax=Shewanella sp. Pdp11 TaxID=2059264 RepID=UPI000CA2FFFE|nr:hypothetical protein [Shewanella sp. Pdp11]AUD60378.1 hypothetical protein AYJ58_13185 [Shewanella sp. Pdp11]